MKNKTFIMIVGGLILVAGVLGIFQLTATTSDAKISLAEAETKATDQFPGEVVEAQLKVKGDLPTYEIEIVDGDKKYLLTLDGNNGEILNLESSTSVTVEESSKKEMPKEEATEDNNSQTETNNNVVINDNSNQQESDNNNDNRQSNSNKDTVEMPKSTDSKANDNSTGSEQKTTKENKDKGKESNVTISSEQAAEIALQQVGGKITELELDEDDGKLYYEIELVTDTEEIEMEIDAYTGNIIVLSLESLFD